MEETETCAFCGEELQIEQIEENKSTCSDYCLDGYKSEYYND